MNRIYEAIGKHATCSSHPVWRLATLKFFESKNGWIFGYTVCLGVTLMALEPIPTEDASPLSFLEAWDEFENTIPCKTVLFVGVGQAFAQSLAARGFSTLRVAKEPWVHLENWMPRGNRAKGVRAARNQALRSGLQVSEFSSANLNSNSELQQQLIDIFEKWKEKFILRLSGFLYTIKPIEPIEGRKWFVAFEGEKAVGYLIATPIGAGKRYFLEDLLLSPDCHSGTGELLTCAALESLRNAGVTEASLGIVSKLDASEKLPVLAPIARFFQRLWSPEGMLLFRKRFGPNRWDEIFLAAKFPRRDSREWTAWARGLIALFFSFEPEMTRVWKNRLRLTVTALFIFASAAAIGSRIHHKSKIMETYNRSSSLASFHLFHGAR